MSWQCALRGLGISGLGLKPCWRVYCFRGSICLMVLLQPKNLSYNLGGWNPRRELLWAFRWAAASPNEGLRV